MRCHACSHPPKEMLNIPLQRQNSSLFCSSRYGRGHELGCLWQQKLLFCRLSLEYMIPRKLPAGHNQNTKNCHLCRTHARTHSVHLQPNISTVRNASARKFNTSPGFAVSRDFADKIYLTWLWPLITFLMWTHSITQSVQEQTAKPSNSSFQSSFCVSWLIYSPLWLGRCCHCNM